MIEPLSDAQQRWVDATFAGLRIEDKVAQLLIPTLGAYDYRREAVDAFLAERALGGIFVGIAERDRHREEIAELQVRCSIPLVVASDLEAGAGHFVRGAVPFPEPLAVAAANDARLAYTLGTAAAREGRSAGIHWTYAPVVDVNVNPDNPIANTRSLGDDPDRVARLAAAIARGMQEHGLAACAKHFPGDGVDDLDQHTVTSVNTLSRQQWHRISGLPFRSAIEAGVWSVMVGHIALPAWDDSQNACGVYRPASISHRLVTGLLRGELGFEGLIVSDDMNMGGVAGYARRRDRTVACIAAGCDMLLFPKLPDDYATLLEAVRSGVVPEERIDDAVRRILAFKARLNLHTGALFGPGVAAHEQQAFADASRQIAAAAVVKVRDLHGILPIRHLRPGSRVLTITLASDFQDVPDVDRALRARGYEVDHVYNPDDLRLSDRTFAYDAVFVNFIFKAAWGVQSVRSVGTHNRMFIGGFYSDHPCVVFTSFGSPYHLRMFSTLPNYLNVHSSCPDSQRAAVQVWFGEAEACGSSPVAQLVRTYDVG
ncbi:MAG TPA: glycoside hydrolase family 3 N-terminal domain-containing protein [Candidatus Tectomicrobia bacterium]|nr:glycoside hydrolase family 3 N-terminal domain-containing protein [Candidatus Tectomicrobia bacterium]